MKPFELGDIEMTGSTGIDSMLERESHIVSPFPSRKKIATLKDISEFVRVSGETLVHKSQRDLWALSREGDNYFIERLFDDNGSPLKG